MHLPLFFLTDFGLSDPYVGIMKGVALSLGHEGQIVDLVHEVPPQDIIAGAVAIEDALPWLPPRCAVVAVVDPGVGTERRCLAVQHEGRFFIGPDNGLLTPVMFGDSVVREIEAGGPILPSRSATFHGRDVFTPAATLLTTGQRPFEGIGPEIQDAKRLDFPKLEILNNGDLLLTFLHADHFGNLATNLRLNGVPEGIDLSRGRFLFGDRDFGPLRRTFADVDAGKPVVYFNAADRLEVAVSMGNAMETYGAEALDTIIFRPEEAK